MLFNSLLKQGGNKMNIKSYACFLIIVIATSLFLNPSSLFAKERKVRVTMDFNLKAPENSNKVRLWLPYVISDKNQTVSDIKINGNYDNYYVTSDNEFGDKILYAEWAKGHKEWKMTYEFTVTRKEHITKDFTKKEIPFSETELKHFLKPQTLMPLDGKVKETALKITKGKKTNLEKAKAIYDWIVENMYRDPNVKGCGFGDVEKLLITMGGKCADIHSVFVALARASGVPAREIWGIRIPKGKSGNMTKAQHCWAEFYNPGYGWVVVDPADVRKAILEQNITLEQAKPLREYFFGAVDENRIAFGMGRDLILNPPQDGKPLIYFMYPYAEVDGKPLNEDLYGFNIGYNITFKEF